MKKAKYGTLAVPKLKKKKKSLGLCVRGGPVDAVVSHFILYKINSVLNFLSNRI